MEDRRERFLALEASASGRWSDIIQTLSGVDVSDAIVTRKHVRCHRDHGNTRSQFRVFKDFDETGGGVCNTCGSFANGFALLTFLNGWDYRQAVKEVAHYLEGRGQLGTPCAIIKPRPKTWEVSEENLMKLKLVWRGSKPLKGSRGESYLRKRGITSDLPDTSEVRFHSRLHYWDNDNGSSGGYFPGIVSLLRTAQHGEPVTIHRTYLNSDGKKAPVSRPKKLMACAIDGIITALGAAVRLYPLNGKYLSVTEGIETALAIRSAHPEMPVWSCYSAAVLSNFQPPDEVEHVLIWGDLDAKGAGQLAAAKLALRLLRRGLRANVILPTKSAVYVPRDKQNGWFSKDAPRDAIVSCLEANGYEVTDQAGLISQDWLDVWGESKSTVVNAIRAISAHQAA